MKPIFDFLVMTTIIVSTIVGYEFSYAQLRGSEEVYVYNRDIVTHTFDASAEGRVRWVRNRPSISFQTTSQYGEVSALEVSPSGWGGWDFEDSGSNDSPAGILAYSKYKIWTNDGHVYIDFRDTYFIQDGRFGSMDVYLYYYGDYWRCVQHDFTDTVQVTNGGTIEIWELMEHDIPDQDSLKIPVTVRNSFTGGQITLDGATYNSPRTRQWSLNSSHSIAAISPQTIGSANYVWCNWSDGGGQTHNISVHGNSYSQTYTANFLGSYISGPDFLYNGQNGTYNSNPSGGSGNRSYQWYRKYDGSSTWDPLGVSQTQQVTMHSTGFTLKVNVTDNVYSKTVTSTKYVSYGAFAGEDSTAIEDNGGSSAGLQNHPNPFNPQTTISYRLSQENHVTLKVYDMLGREVITLVDERQAAGKHSTSFNASSLASGIYWYRLQIGSFSENKKFTLIR